MSAPNSTNPETVPGTFGKISAPQSTIHPPPQPSSQTQSESDDELLPDPVTVANTRRNSRDNTYLHRPPVDANQVGAVNAEGYNTTGMDRGGDSVFLPAKGATARSSA
ncbi:hypothetical protein HDV00_004648 [Rhizophlyctis rosea]|nr:hypothetical protein HDV00_004648 [Rhizophlyctis rosea]